MSVFLLIVVMAACGGKVVFDGAPSGGSGSGSGEPSGAGGSITTTGPTMSSSASLSSTSGTSSMSTATGVPDVSALCASVCIAESNSNCKVGGNCAPECQGLFDVAPCGPELASFDHCVVGDPNALGCSPPGPVLKACGAEFDAWTACAGPTCALVGACTITMMNDHCICDGDCLGQNARIDCESGGCGCYVNGLLVGACLSPEDDCDFTTSCCLPFFALPH
jgi:hypothetical protein